MKAFFLLVCASLFSSALWGGDAFTHTSEYDFDGDGVPDQLVVERTPVLEDTDSADFRVRITFSSNAQPVDVVFVGDPEEFHVMPCRVLPKCLVIDYTRYAGWKYNKSYDLYTWDDGHKKMCLYASVYQVMPEQDDPEVETGLPKKSSVIAYKKCQGLGGSGLGAETSDEPAYWEANRIPAKVVVAKAWLYSSPDVRKKTKMYLVEGDAPVIKEHRYIRGKDWYLVEYLPIGRTEPIVKWVQGSSIGLQLS